MDGYLANRIVGTTALCNALEHARDEAASDGFGLLLWDGYRPQRAVNDFLRWSRQPEDGRTNHKAEGIREAEARNRRRLR